MPDIPADYFTSTYAYGADAVSLIADLDEAQAALAGQAKTLTARPAAAEARELHARTEAVHAPSLSTAHRCTRGSTAHLAAYGQVLGEAT